MNINNAILYFKKIPIKQIIKGIAEIFFALFLCFNIILAASPDFLLYFHGLMTATFLPMFMNWPGGMVAGVRIYHAISSYFSFQSAIMGIILSCLMLTYLFNMAKVNSAIKQFFKKKNFLPIIRIENSAIQAPLPAPLNIFLIVFSCFLFFLFFYNFFTTPPIIHYETFTNQTFVKQMRTGTYVITDLIPTIFNKMNFEGGGYRPRVMSFLVDYININALPVLNRIFPFWGMRKILSVIAVPLTILSVYLLLNHFFKTMAVGIKLFFSVVPLFFTFYIQGMSNFYRTSKFLVIPLALFLLYYFLKKLDINCELKKAYKLLPPLFLVFLCTIYDEQLIAVVVYLAFASVFLTVFNKKFFVNTFVFTGAVLSWLSWHFIIGRWLFGIFTPYEMIDHVHTYSSLLGFFSFQKIAVLVTTYFHLIIFNFIFFPAIIIISLVLVLVGAKKQFTADLLHFPVFVIILSFLLSCAVALGHAGIIHWGMVNTWYNAAPFYLFYIGVLYLFCHILSNYSNNVLKSVIFLSLSVLILTSNNTNMREINAAIRGGSTVFSRLEHSDVEELGDQRIIDLHNMIIEKNINQNFVYFVADWMLLIEPGEESEDTAEPEGVFPGGMPMLEAPVIPPLFAPPSHETPGEDFPGARPMF